MLDIFTMLFLCDNMLSHGVISWLCWQAHYPSSYSNQCQAYQFSRFLQLPSSSEAYPTRLEQLLKYQLGLWGAPREFYGQPHT